MLLSVGKKYNLNNVKEIEITEDFLGLDQSVIKCQTRESIDTCKEWLYIDSLMAKCGCLPFSLNRADDKVNIGIIEKLPIKSINNTGSLHYH